MGTRSQNLCEPNKYKFVHHHCAHFTLWRRNFNKNKRQYSFLFRISEVQCTTEIFQHIFSKKYVVGLYLADNFFKNHIHRCFGYISVPKSSKNVPVARVRRQNQMMRLFLDTVYMLLLLRCMQQTTDTRYTLSVIGVAAERLRRNAIGPRYRLAAVRQWSVDKWAR